MSEQLTVEKIRKDVESLEDKHCIVAINKSDLEIHFDRSKIATFDPLEVSAKKGFIKLMLLFLLLGAGFMMIETPSVIATIKNIPTGINKCET